MRQGQNVSYNPKLSYCGSKEEKFREQLDDYYQLDKGVVECYMVS